MSDRHLFAGSELVKMVVDELHNNSNIRAMRCDAVRCQAMIRRLAGITRCVWLVASLSGGFCALFIASHEIESEGEILAHSERGDRGEILEPNRSKITRDGSGERQLESRRRSPKLQWPLSTPTINKWPERTFKSSYTSTPSLRASRRRQ